MRIGDKVTAYSDMSDIEGIIVRGVCIETGTKTNVIGEEIDLDNVVSIDDGGGDIVSVNGWLWTFDVEPA